MSNKTKRIIGYSIIVIIVVSVLGGFAFILIDALGIIEGVIVFLVPFITVGLLVFAASLIKDSED